SWRLRMLSSRNVFQPKFSRMESAIRPLCGPWKPAGAYAAQGWNWNRSSTGRSTLPPKVDFQKNSTAAASRNSSGGPSERTAARSFAFRCSVSAIERRQHVVSQRVDAEQQERQGQRGGQAGPEPARQQSGQAPDREQRYRHHCREEIPSLRLHEGQVVDHI